MKLRKCQLRSVADISKDIAQVVLAGMVIDPLVTREVDFGFLIGGIILSSWLWYVNLLIVGRVEK